MRNELESGKDAAFAVGTFTDIISGSEKYTGG